MASLCRLLKVDEVIVLADKPKSMKKLGIRGWKEKMILKLCNGIIEREKIASVEMEIFLEMFDLSEFEEIDCSMDGWSYKLREHPEVVFEYEPDEFYISENPAKFEDAEKYLKIINIFSRICGEIADRVSPPEGYQDFIQDNGTDKETETYDKRYDIKVTYRTSEELTLSIHFKLFCDKYILDFPHHPTEVTAENFTLTRIDSKYVKVSDIFKSKKSR